MLDAADGAEFLEKILFDALGPTHPDTIGILTVRSWLVLSTPNGHPAETLELLLETAERRIAGLAEPRSDTTRIIWNAHVLWQQLRDEHAEIALKAAASLMPLLQNYPRRMKDVMEWVANVAPPPFTPSWRQAGNPALSVQQQQRRQRRRRRLHAHTPLRRLMPFIVSLAVSLGVGPGSVR